MENMPYTDKKGRVYGYGEFFPFETSPFAYNESLAQEYFPINKEVASKIGYRWKEPEEKNYQITMEAMALPDNINDTQDSIINEMIGCTHLGKCNQQCTTAFKITTEDLKIYRSAKLPLPRLCPNCRHYERLKQRNPLKLRQRQCMCRGKQSENSIYQNGAEHRHGTEKCSNEFETSYAPDRPEIVYCESCYNSEVA